MNGISPAMARRRAGLAKSRRFLDLIARVLPSPGGLTAPPRKIHVALLWGIGDAVTALPLVQALKRKWPMAEIAVVGKAWLLDLFRDEAVSVIRLDAPWTAFSRKYRIWDKAWRHFFGQLVRLRRAKPDLWINFRFDPRDVLLARLSGASAIAGFGGAGAARWLAHDLPISAEEFDQLYSGAVGARLAQVITGAETSAIPRFAQSRAGNGNRSVVVGFGASHPIRRWDPAKIQSVVDGLIARELDVTIIDDRAGPLPEASAARIWSGSLAGLKQTLAGADLFVGADSGPLHIAAALGVPTVGVFGPGSLERFAPRGPQDRWIAEPIACRPCFDACIFATPHCLDALQPSQVLAAVDRAMAQSRNKDS